MSPGHSPLIALQVALFLGLELHCVSSREPLHNLRNQHHQSDQQVNGVLKLPQASYLLIKLLAVKLQ